MSRNMLVFFCATLFVSVASALLYAPGTLSHLTVVDWCWWALPVMVGNMLVVAFYHVGKHWPQPIFIGVAIGNLILTLMWWETADKWFAAIVSVAFIILSCTQRETSKKVAG